MSEQSDNAFLRFARVVGGEPARPVEEMTEEETNTLLMSGGTHVLKLERKFAEFLKRGQKEMALEKAKERRKNILSAATQSFKAGSAVGAELLSRARALIDVLGKKDPEQAAIFARKFEETTAEDVDSLAHEVAILEAMSGENEDSNRGDKS
jgi:hypothetical protein